MTGILAQIISLTTFGNDFLNGGNASGNYYPENSTFKFCNKVGFEEFEKSFFSSKMKEKVIAENPLEWFAYLKKKGCKKLRLFFEHTKDKKYEDHKMAAFVGGGGTWMIEAVYNDHSNYWASKWQVTKKDDPEKKIWTVSYATFSEHQKITNMQLDIDKMRSTLFNTLSEIQSFAAVNGQIEWSVEFQNAKEILSSDNPVANYYHKDLIPLENFTKEKRQLIFAAASAWVFGGMGSWNDIGFDTQEENEQYEKLSALLYSCIIDSVIGVVND